MFYIFGMGAPKKPTANELRIKRHRERKERAEQIDNLLDIANWNRKMMAKTGDESYGVKVAEVEKQLARLVEK